MKKIREILFTIVMIASCGYLLNVNTLASLPQNFDPLEDWEKASEKLLENIRKLPDNKAISLPRNCKLKSNSIKIITNNDFYGDMALDKTIDEMTQPNNFKIPGLNLTTSRENLFEEEENAPNRPIKPYEEWLAEKEKNEREGNFTTPSVYKEEGGQVTEEQENSWLLPSSLNEDGEND